MTGDMTGGMTAGALMSALPAPAVMTDGATAAAGAGALRSRALRAWQRLEDRKSVV